MNLIKNVIKYFSNSSKATGLTKMQCRVAGWANRRRSPNLVKYLKILFKRYYGLCIR